VRRPAGQRPACGRSLPRPLSCLIETGAAIYAGYVGEPVDVESERWGDDPRLEALLGTRGAAGFRALLEGFPDAVGIVWPLRDGEGRITDFALGYGNPAMLRRFRLPAATRDRYTLLEALPRMRGSRAFSDWIKVCETGRPWIREIVYDTPFGDGYMLGTFVQRVARLGDGLLVVLTDVTEQRRNEAELRNFADLVAHDLREPITGIAHLISMLERWADRPPSPEVLRLLRESAERAHELIDGVLSYARAGELRRERIDLGGLMAEVGEDLRPLLGRRSRPASYLRSRATPAICAVSCRTSSATRSSSAASSRPGSTSPRAAATTNGSSSCATTASGWIPTRRHGSSTCSRARAPPPTAAGSGSRSAAASSRRTAA
jgi:hypothetical protein